MRTILVTFVDAVQVINRSQARRILARTGKNPPMRSRTPRTRAQKTFARQRSGGGGRLQLFTQVRNADGIAGPAQSQARQKLQSICAQPSTAVSCDRQSAIQVALLAHKLPMSPTNGWFTQSICTRCSWPSQASETDLSSQPRNRPPPQTQAMVGSQVLGHQQASVWIAQRSPAAQQSHSPSDVHAPVGVDPSGPPLPLIDPPQP